MQDQAPTIGFIGLGVMGGPMCRNVVRKHPAPVYAFDLNPAAMRDAGGGRGPTHPLDRGSSGGLRHHLSVPSRRQAGRGGLLRQGRHRGRGPARIDRGRPQHDQRCRSTRGRRAARRGGIEFADSPVARTREAAAAGTLSIMVGASAALFARIEPLLRYMGSDVTHCGAIGCGQVVKLINNTLVFEHVAALAEMMVVGERAGVAPDILLQAVSKGSGDSFVLRNHGMKAMLPRNFPEKSFPPEYVLKDLGYTIELAKAAACSQNCLRWWRHITRRPWRRGWVAATFRSLSS